MPSVIRGNDNFDSANGSPNATVGAVGTYAFLARASSAAAVTAGGTVAGSTMRYSSVQGNPYYSGTPAGTWRVMGYIGNFTNDIAAITVCLRIS